MPIYDYRCESCGFQQDVLQKMSDPRLTDCPQCNQPTLKKQLTAAGFQLKGSGWYVTDFRDNGKKSATPNAAADAAKDGSAKTPAENPAQTPAAESSASNATNGKDATPVGASPPVAAPSPAAAVAPSNPTPAVPK